MNSQDKNGGNTTKKHKPEWRAQRKAKENQRRGTYFAAKDRNGETKKLGKKN